MKIRTYQSADAQAVLALNSANVPEVGEMDEAKLALFVEISPFFKIVEAEGEVVGLLVGLTEQSTRYPSSNYQWFVDRHAKFSYIDRIAIAEVGRGRGWGPALYKKFAAWAIENGSEWLCAEVNTEPDNPRSHRFHQLFGFTDVQRCRPYSPDGEVAMYEMPLAVHS